MKKRHLILIGVIIAVVISLYYLFFVMDSSLNLYNKYRIKGYAEEYINETYPDLELNEVNVTYDKVTECYVAECICKDKTIFITFNGVGDVESDRYFNQKCAAKVSEYQKKIEKQTVDFLTAAEIPFDSVSIYAEPDDSSKKDIVINNAPVKNAELEYTVTLIRKKGEDIMDEFKTAEYMKSVGDCIYENSKDPSAISALNIKYVDYNSKHIASINWEERMENMTIYSIAKNEIKF
ncbi:MAG: hypothetical protein E7415_03755 [Ruminococcaceae bacterium]|nr:hypothetical protein [Oscillospiraceae bacterium]